MKIEEYTALTESIDKGEVRAVYNALKFSAGVLENIGKQLPPDVRREEVEQALYLTWRLCDVVMFHTMPASYWRGPEKQEQRPPVADDDDFITRSSYEDHWQNKGRQFFEDVAKNIREKEIAADKVKEGTLKAAKDRSILEKKAAAFDEIGGEIVGMYRAVNTVRACVDGDCDQYKVHLAIIDAMFSLGVIAQIITTTKEDVA